MPDQAGLRPQQQQAARGDLGDGRARGKATPGTFRLRCDAGEGGCAGNCGRTGAGDALLGCGVAVESVAAKSRRWRDGAFQSELAHLVSFEDIRMK